MIEVLLGFVVGIIKDIATNAVSYGSNQIQKRRTLLASLLDIYNAISDIEENTIKLQAEFVACASGDTVPSIVISEKRLIAVRDSFKHFQEKSDQICRILEIYDHRLSGLIANSRAIKMSIWSQIDVTEQIFPSIETDQRGKKTFIISFPTQIPSKNSFELIDEKIGHEDIDYRKMLFEDDLIRKFERSTVNIRDRETLKAINVTTSAAISEFREARESLSKLIRDNFDLNTIVI